MWPGTPVALWMKRHNRWMWQRQRAQTVYNNRKYVRPAVKTFKSVSCCGSRASTSRRRQLPRCSPHQEAPRRKGPAGFHRINKTVTHKDRRRKGQTLVHNRRATAQPKELSECSWRTDSHTHTQTSTSNLCTCSYWRLCVSLTSAWFSSFGVKRFIQETLTHLAILYKQHADGVLGAEVEYVNVVLNSHLREWLHPRRGGERRMTGWGTRSNMWVITLQVPFKDGHCWFMCAVYWIKRAAVLRNLSLFHKHTGLQSHWISRVSSQKNISKHHLIISNTTHFHTQPNKLK